MSDAIESSPPPCWLAVAFQNGEERVVGAAFDKWEALLDAAVHGFFSVVVRRLADGPELEQ